MKLKNKQAAAGNAGPEKAKPKVSFGELLGLASPEGYPESGLSLIIETPGARAECLLYSATASLIEQGRTVIFICISRPVEMIEETANSLGLDFSGRRKAGMLYYIDEYSRIFGTAHSSIAFSGKKPGFKANALESLEELIAEAGGKSFVVADSISTMLDVKKGSDYDAIQLIDFCAKKRTGILGLFTDWNYPPKLIERILGKSDYVVAASFSGNLGTVRQCVFLSKPFLGILVPFRFSRTMQAVPVTPKIIVAGPKESGKTSLIYSACENADTVKGTHVTIEMDHGEARIMNCDYLLLSSQPEEFGHFLSIFGEDIAGAAIVVNASANRTFADVAGLIQSASAHCIPFVVLANRLGKKQFSSEEKIMALLGMHDSAAFFNADSSQSSSKEFNGNVRSALSQLAGKAYFAPNAESKNGTLMQKKAKK